VDNQDKYRLSQKATILEALRKIDESAIAMVVVCRGEEAVGVLTDGDLRRALINGALLTDPIESFYSRRFFSVSPDVSRADVLEMMQARSIDQVPIIDRERKVLGVHTIHSILGSEEKENWAVIMAGGKGLRLGALTEKTPKPMLKVAGRPILERIVLHLVHFGIRRIFISVNFLGHVIEDYFGDGSNFGCRIEYLKEDKPLGTGGALSLLPEGNLSAVLVMNGDLVMQTNMEKMLRFHEKGGFYATMGIRPYAVEVAYGCAETNGDLLVGLKEKPVLQEMVNAGVYVLSPQAVASVPAQTEFPITALFDRAFREKVPCGAYPIQEEWMDVGQPQDLRTAMGLHL
jgi:dTDP-glucose pyrophosphorylase